MNDLMNFTTLTMSSLEIAELVESRHDSVKRTIERCAEKGVFRLPPMVVSEKINNLGLPSKVSFYNLEKRDSIVVVAQLSPEFTARIVDRWQELEEAQKTTPLAADTPATLAFRDLKAGLQIARLLQCPESYAIQIASQHAERLTGYPVTMLANEAQACQDVPQEDVMLEPVELGKLFEMSGAAMNKALATMGLQSKEGGVWVATAEGAKLSTRHAWAKRGKSGYNLKWKAATIEGMIPSRSEQ